MLEDFQCSLPQLQQLAKWFAARDPELCRPCVLRPLAQWYLNTLESAGDTAHAEELKQSFAGGDVLTVAKTMDKIKKSVGDNLRADLQNLDCFAQSFKDMQDADDQA
jgi:hypothetical protein